MKLTGYQKQVVNEQLQEINSIKRRLATIVDNLRNLGETKKAEKLDKLIGKLEYFQITSCYKDYKD